MVAKVPLGSDRGLGFCACNQPSLETVDRETSPTLGHPALYLTAVLS